MKTYHIALIAGIIFIVSSVIAITILGTLSLDKNLETVTYDKEYSFESTDIKALDIDLVSTDIQLSTEGENISLIHKGTCTYGTLSKEEQPIQKELLAEKISDSIFIKMQHHEWSFKQLTYFSDCDDTLTIIIPKNSTTLMNIDVVSSDIELKDVNLDFLDVTTISGDIKAIGTISQFNLNSVSGDVDVDIVDKATVDTVSGEVNINLLSEGNFDSVSGDITIGVREGTEIHFDTVSGELYGTTNKGSTSPIKFDTVSGDVRVNVIS